ncbi:MAG: DUF58 domain-containing protein [Planctomycetes bacterium]|nr:DUF58 domain-containing protein [Planctomycetota bacterium]
MLTREVLRQVRRLHLRARRAVEDPLGGAYRSVFKGAGIAFEEVREYQPGDEIRSIDWNVTARMGHPFIKRHVEERELTVVLLMDVSASMSFGTLDQTKREVVAEIAALLTLCAVSNNDKVGLALVTNSVERYVPPRKGPRHALRLIRDLFVHVPQRKGTNLSAGLDYLNKILKRRSLVFVFSDFLDTGYEQAMRRMARTHDTVAVPILDPREEALPDVGLLETQDAETGQSRLVDTSCREFQRAIQNDRHSWLDAFKQWTRAHRIDLLETSTRGRHLDDLMRFFEQRDRRLRHS